MARAAFPIADRVSLADVGEYMKRKSDGHEGLVLGEVQAALVDGCGVELVWIKEGWEVCREYPEPDFWRRQILVWHGVLPRRLHVQLPPEEQKGDTLLTFLRLSEAVRHGLRPASEAPQAEQQHDLLLVAAVENRLKAGHQPGGNEQWDRFCDEVRSACKKKATDRGYGDKTIKRIVRTIRTRQNKQDI